MRAHAAFTAAKRTTSAEVLRPKCGPGGLDRASASSAVGCIRSMRCMTQQPRAPRVAIRNGPKGPASSLACKAPQSLCKSRSCLHAGRLPMLWHAPRARQPTSFRRFANHGRRFCVHHRRYRYARCPATECPEPGHPRLARPRRAYPLLRNRQRWPLVGTGCPDRKTWLGSLRMRQGTPAGMVSRSTRDRALRGPPSGASVHC